VSFPQDVPACYTPSSKRPAARMDATRHLYQTVILRMHNARDQVILVAGVIAAPALSLPDAAQVLESTRWRTHGGDRLAEWFKSSFSAYAGRRALVQRDPGSSGLHAEGRRCLPSLG
jgi:hypothetical protein